MEGGQVFLWRELERRWLSNSRQVDSKMSKKDQRLPFDLL